MSVQALINTVYLFNCQNDFPNDLKAAPLISHKRFWKDTRPLKNILFYRIPVPAPCNAKPISLESA
jgi:hypothetical protein